MDFTVEDIYGRKVDVTIALASYAAQENCDGDEWDAMQKASEVILYYRNMLNSVVDILKTDCRVCEEWDNDYPAMCRTCTIRRALLFIKGEGGLK